MGVWEFKNWFGRASSRDRKIGKSLSALRIWGFCGTIREELKFCTRGGVGGECATINMEQREIELTIISAQDLKNVKSFGGKMSPYAVAWVYPNMKVPTPMAPGGGENPTWNANLKLVCEERLVEQGNLVITIDLYNHSSFSNKSIGSASLPLPQNMTGDGKSQGSKNGTQSKVISLPV